MKEIDQAKVNPDNVSESGEQERLKRLYKFLLLKIDLGIRDSEKSQPNESFVGYQLGLENYRVFVRKILRAALPEYYEKSIPSGEEGNLAPSIELSKLVEILDSIDQYSSGIRDKYSKKQKSEKLPTKFTTQDKITALKLYSELSKEERDRLKLPMDENAKLLAQLIDRLNSPTIYQSKNLLKKLYKHTVENGFMISEPESRSGVDKLQEIIIKSVMKLLRVYYQDSPLEEKELEKEAIRYEGKVMREMYRILIQSGLQQLSEIIDPSIELAAVVKKLPDEIVSKLICSIVENEMLTQDFPVFIKWIDFKRVRPLPLRIRKTNLPDGLLSDKLVDDSDDIGISGFENQTAHSVTVHFKMKNMGSRNSNGETQDFRNEYFEFSEEITGIGSPVSLATVAINRVLLWDIECLREIDIFPTAKQVLVHNTILDDSPHSAVWCHTLIQLHTRKSIEHIVNQSNINENSESCDSLDLFNSQSHGDFCAFDVLEAITKSGLHARLRAIKNLGVKPKEYLEGLQYKVIESIVVRRAKSRLKFYPFSFWAMQGELEKDLFAKNGELIYRVRQDHDELNSAGFEEKDNNKSWSLFAYDAHLTLAETLLNEGKQSTARQYLKQIQLHVNRTEPRCILTDLMKARYHYLMARYLYLYDLKEGDGTYKDRSSAILAMRKELDEAKKYMQHRVKMCEVIGELSQSNNHPFFSLLGKINFLQARLNLGFCSYLNISYPENLKKVLMFLQAARICAARDGSADEYSCYSAFQSWAYSMIAYSGEVELLQSLDLDKSKCLEWSKELIDHATICYDETGRKSYEQVKFHAGDTEPSEYGDVKIERPPFIREFPNAHKEFSADENPDILHIPYFNSVFEQKPKKIPTYGSPDALVFGTNSSALFLAYGMQKLSQIESTKVVNLREELDKIFQHLLAAYVTAKDGGRTDKNEEGIKIVERNFNVIDLHNPYPISRIRGLYLHRIGYIVPLSAVALYLCGILKMMHYHYLYANGGATLDTIIGEIEDFTKMKAVFLDDIHEKTDAENSFNLQKTSQGRFNGYIETHLAGVIEYYRTVVEELQLTTRPVEKPDHEDKLKNAEYMSRWKNSIDDCLTWRDKLMKNLLRLIVGIGTELID
jgi:hypothetical protein